MKRYNMVGIATSIRALLSGLFLMAIAGSQTAAFASEADRHAEGKNCPIPDFVQATSITSPTGITRSADEIRNFVTDRMTAHKIPGASIAIINDGATMFHHAIGVANVNTGEKVTNCTIFQGASITKPLFGYFVMTFVEEGRLDLDRPLFEYLPYPAIADDVRYKKITARMALTHQTGFPNWRTDYPDNRLFLQFDPGTAYHYSGEGYKYLTLVLQKIAGVDAQGLESLFRQRVAGPLGLTNTQIVPDADLLARTAGPHLDGQAVSVKSANSYRDFGAAYGVHSEAYDFSKWIKGLIDRKILSPASFEEYFRPQNVPIPADEPLRNFGLKDYALGFAVYDLPFGRRYIHGGNNPGFTSLISVDRQHEWGVVIFTNADQVTDFAVELLVFLNTPSQ